MNQSKILPARPSEPDFRNPMHRREITKAAGLKYFRSSVLPYMTISDSRTGASEKIHSPPRKTFFDESRPITSFRCDAMACQFSVQSGLAQVIRPDTPFCAHAAAKHCTTLERFQLTCQPTIFAGRHLALD